MAILGHGERQDGIGNPPFRLFTQAWQQRPEQVGFEGHERGLVAKAAAQLDASQQRLADPFPPARVRPVEAEQPTAHLVVDHVHLSGWAVHEPLEDRERFVDQAGRHALAQGGEGAERLAVDLRTQPALRHPGRGSHHRAERRLEQLVRHDVGLGGDHGQRGRPLPGDRAGQPLGDVERHPELGGLGRLLLGLLGHAGVDEVPDRRPDLRDEGVGVAVAT